MTAIKATPSSSQAAEAAASSQVDAPQRRAAAMPPSATEEEARTRFASALSKGVDALLERGHGRERASAELLNEIAGGCSPNEDEVFQTMESLGISLEDATKVMTVSSAYRAAHAANDGSSAGAIDELTSRLNLADLIRGGGRASRSPSPSPSTTSVASGANMKMTELARNESLESLQSHRSASSSAKKCQRPSSARGVKPSNQQPRGRKRALAEKTPPEKRDSNVMIDEQQPQKKAAAAAADLEVKEKMALSAKLSKAEQGKGKPRERSPDGGKGGRAKRAAPVAPVLRASVEEAQSSKRPRTRSQTEESIPAILDR